MAENFYLPGQTFNYAAAASGGATNALRTLQFQQGAETLQKSRTVEATGRQASAGGTYDAEAHAKLLEQAGLPMEAENLRRLAIGTESQKALNTVRDLQIITTGLQIVRESANFIASIEDKTERQAQWANLRQGMIDKLGIDGNLIPEKADPKILLRIGRNAADMLKIMQVDIPQKGGTMQRAIVGVDPSAAGATNPLAFQQNLGAPFTPKAESGQGPTTSERKAREISERLQKQLKLSKEEADQIATEVAFDFIKQGQDARGNVIFINQATKQPVLTLERILGSSPPQYRAIHHQGSGKDPLGIR